MSILNRFRFLFGIGKVHQRMSQMDKTIQRLQKDKEKSDREIDRHKHTIDDLHKSLETEYGRIQDSLGRAAQVNKKLEMALTGAQDEIHTLKEITVPGLVAANQVLIQRWEAESQIFAMRAAVKSEDVV